MIHSPLTNKTRRLTTYEALLDLQAKGTVEAVGVCNFGVRPLTEITNANLPAPSVTQLILSPFNQHKLIQAWANEHSSTLSCSAWSRLSSADGPQKGWAVVSAIAAQRGMAKANVLIGWALQNNFLSVPRSSAKFKIERQAIAENSWKGTSSFALSKEETAILNNLDEQLPAGRLGALDGWDESAIVDESWDPTLVV